MRNYTTGLRRVTAQIRTVKELRRIYIAEQKQQYQEDMDAYIQQISALTSSGLSTKRLVNESDEDYAARMYDNVQSITTQEQLYDGQLYILREFISKLRSLNVPLEVVESASKQIPDDAKEWILSHWPKVQALFIKTFGTNPYRVSILDLSDFFGRMHHDSTVHHLGDISGALQDTYDHEMDSMFPRNFESKSVKLERQNRVAQTTAHEDLPADEYAKQ